MKNAVLKLTTSCSVTSGTSWPTWAYTWARAEPARRAWPGTGRTHSNTPSSPRPGLFRSGVTTCDKNNVNKGCECWWSGCLRSYTSCTIKLKFPSTHNRLLLYSDHQLRDTGPNYQEVCWPVLPTNTSATCKTTWKLPWRRWPNVTVPVIGCTNFNPHQKMNEYCTWPVQLANTITTTDIFSGMHNAHILSVGKWHCVNITHFQIHHSSTYTVHLYVGSSHIIWTANLGCFVSLRSFQLGEVRHNMTLIKSYEVPLPLQDLSVPSSDCALIPTYHTYHTETLPNTVQLLH